MPAFAQLDRSVRPEPGEAREPEIADYKKYELDNGITLIVVENHKLPQLSIQLSLDIDPIVEGDKAGMISLAGDLMREGTTTRTKEQLDEEIDFMGARLSTFSSGAYAAGLSKYSDKLMELMADVVLNPSFSQEAFDKLKEQNMSGLRSNADDPSALSRNLYNSRLYGLDHAMGEVMTEETLDNVTLEDCRSYWNTYFKPNVTYIAIVGDIKPRKAKKLVEEYFENWQPAEVPTHEVSVPALPEATYVAMINRPTSVQSEIRIGNRVELHRSSPDLVAMEVANTILGGGSMARLFLNLREDKSFTYGAYSNIGVSEYVTAFTANAAVKNEVTDSAVTEFLYEINRMRDELVTPEELQNAKNYLAGSFGRSLERAQTVANFGLNIERFGLDEDYYNEYLQRLEAVTAEDVQAAARKYMAAENLTIAIVGKSSEVADGLAQFGEVLYFDKYGNPASNAELVPEGLTAVDVMNNYAEALGGRAKLDAVKKFEYNATGNLRGMMEISMSRTWTPTYYEETVTTPMGGQSKVVDNGNVTMTANGVEQPLSAEEAAEEAADVSVFELVDHSNDNMKLLPEVADVDGVRAYAVEITKGEDVVTHYFSIETGLRIRNSRNVETPQGSFTLVIDFSNFEEVNGIMLPKKYTLPLGPGAVVEMNVTSASIQ